VGDAAPPDLLAARVLGGHEPAEGHEGAGGREAAPVADLACDRERPELGDALVSRQPGDRRRERRTRAVLGELGLDRRQLGLARAQGAPVVGKRRARRLLLKALLGDEGLVLRVPVLAVEDSAVSEQEPVETMWTCPGLTDSFGQSVTRPDGQRCG